MSITDPEQAANAAANGHRSRNGAAPPSENDREVIARLVQAVSSGQEWFPALLRAIADWTAAQEVWEGRSYRYLIGGEAFDWLLLAERLLAEARHAVPEEEQARLLFLGQMPPAVDAGRFRELIGTLKYRAHLNFVYGVIVEEAVQQALLEEAAKAHQNQASRERVLEEETWQRLYAAPFADLLIEFQSATGFLAGEATHLEEQREFTYWLFKRRVAKSEPARLASDTRKGLLLLARLRPAAWRWVQSEVTER